MAPHSCWYLHNDLHVDVFIMGIFELRAEPATELGSDPVTLRGGLQKMLKITIVLFFTGASDQDYGSIPNSLESSNNIIRRALAHRRLRHGKKIIFYNL